MLKTEKDHLIGVIEGLMKAVTVRRQIHGCGDINLEDFNSESDSVSEARQILAEKARIAALPHDPWFPG